MTPADQLLTSAQVAARLGISRQRIAQLVALGRLRPAMQLPAGDRLFDPREVERFAAAPKSRGGRPRKRR